MELHARDKQLLYEEFCKLNQEVEVMQKMIKQREDRMEQIIPYLNVKLLSDTINSRFEILDFAEL